MATNQLDYQNFFSTVLSTTITATDTTLYLNTLPTPSEGYLVIEPDSDTNKEIIYYTSKGANYVTCPDVATGRGVGGTTAASHSSGATVQRNVVAEDLREVQNGNSNTGLHQYFDESFADYVLSGGSITQATGLIASISSGVAYINGRRLPFNAMSKTLTASKDTYIDLVETDGSNIATVSYTELASGATGSAPVSNGLHIGMVQTHTASITRTVQSGTDVLGNPIKTPSTTAAVNIDNPYKFSVYRAGALSIGAGATAKVTFETESFDTNNNFDAVTNNRYTAPVNGFYNFSAAVSIAVNANLYGIILYKNGSSVKRGNFSSTGAVATDNIFVVNTLLQLTAGDYIEVFMFNNSGGSAAISVGAEKTYFTGFLVSRT